MSKRRRKERWYEYLTPKERQESRRNKKLARIEARAKGRAKSFKKRLVRDATPAEKVLIDRLEKEHICFKFQEIVRSHTQFRIVDFWVSRLNNTPLVIELDGEYHEEEKQKSADGQREKWLKQMIGCEILRFTNEEVYSNMDEVIATIKGKHVLLQLST